MGRQVDHQAILQRAYDLWRARGCADGYAEEDWLQAERELLDEQSPHVTPSPTKAVDESIQQSFPASDPPASRLPDEPPVNADDKWAAASEAAERGEGEVTPFANPMKTEPQAGRNKRPAQAASTVQPSKAPPGAARAKVSNGDKRKFSDKH